jgi:alkane 1-monooxygenase
VNQKITGEPSLGDSPTFTPLGNAAPYFASLAIAPVVGLAAYFGGWTILLVPISTWVLFTILDAIGGLDLGNPDTETPDDQLYWHRLVTYLWVPAQLLVVFGSIGYMTSAAHLSVLEMLAVAFGVGVLSGTIGIVYAHELMHQSSRFERWLGDILMTMALYGHFRSEHLLVHHRYVGTPRDPVTARYNEGFHRFFPRVLRQSLISSWRAEASKLAKRGMKTWDAKNPFWRYAVLSFVWLGLAYFVGGAFGVVLFLVQAFVAIWQLELVNYVEHYGLTRKHLGEGKYEPTRPHHSWNAAHWASNRLLINLQRHSDHHFNPSRRFPLLQTYSEDDAPQLPHGYPVMTALAMVPPLWRRRMNPRVREWRRTFYPEVTDWTPYSTAANPLPK